MLIDFFHYMGVTVRRYEQISSENIQFRSKILGRSGCLHTKHFSSQKTAPSDLSRGIKSGQIFLKLCYNPRLCQTDGQTDKFSPLDCVCIPCSAV